MFRTVGDQVAVGVGAAAGVVAVAASWRGSMRYWTIRRSSPRRASSTAIGPAVDADGVLLRLMFLKFRYRLGYESLCRGVSDSIIWRRFCRSRWTGGAASNDADEADHPLRHAAVDGLNEALLAKRRSEGAAHHPAARRHHGGPGERRLPTDSGLLAKAVRRIAVTGRRIQPPAARSAPAAGPLRAPGSGLTDRAKLRARARRAARAQARARITGSSPIWPANRRERTLLSSAGAAPREAKAAAPRRVRIRPPGGAVPAAPRGR